jgi:hypothetical protein
MLKQEKRRRAMLAMAALTFASPTISRDRFRCWKERLKS